MCAAYAKPPLLPMSMRRALQRPASGTASAVNSSTKMFWLTPRAELSLYTLQDLSAIYRLVLVLVRLTKACDTTMNPLVWRCM